LLITIAADRQPAKRRAGVRVDCISVVAGFPELGDAIATTGRETRSGATIKIARVAIVAPFRAVQNTVTTERDRASNAGAACAADQTGFEPVRAGLCGVVTVIATLARLEVSVTAPRNSALHGAVIGVRAVAVVTLLPGLNEGVSAPRWDTASGTSIRIAGIAIVARLSSLNIAIATARVFTPHRACVVIRGVPIVARLKRINRPIATVGTHRLKHAAINVAHAADRVSIGAWLGLPVAVVALLASLQETISTPRHRPAKAVGALQAGCAIQIELTGIVESYAAGRFVGCAVTVVILCVADLRNG
jgi:hypothetical protein